MKWQSGGPKKELNPLAGRVPQSQANADRGDPVLRVNTILFSRPICSIRLVQAEGHGGRRPPSAAALLCPSPCLLICSLTACFNRMTPDTELSLGHSRQGLQTLQQPGLLSSRPSEGGAGVQAERHVVRGEAGRGDVCCGFSAHRQIKKRVLCLPLAFLSFFILCPFSSLRGVSLLFLLAAVISPFMSYFLCMDSFFSSHFVLFFLYLEHSISRNWTLSQASNRSSAPGQTRTRLWEFKTQFLHYEARLITPTSGLTVDS